MDAGFYGAKAEPGQLKDRNMLLRDACLQLNDIHQEVQQSDYLGHNFISRAFDLFSKLADDLEALP